MNANDIVRQFGVNYGVAGLALNERGQARIGVDGTLDIELEWSEADGVLHVFSVLGVVAQQERSDVLERALAANLFGSGTAGGALAWDGASGELILCDRLRGEHASAETLKLQIEAMIAAVEALRTSLFGPGAEVAAAPRGDAAFMMRA
jgi:hypothetical protein